MSTALEKKIVHYYEDVRKLRKIIKIFNLKDNSKLAAVALIKSIYKMFLSFHLKFLLG